MLCLALVGVRHAQYLDKTFSKNSKNLSPGQFDRKLVARSI